MQPRAWSRVDSAEDRAIYLEYLRSVSAQEWAKEYKRRTFGALALKQGMRVLDVGCGRGDDVIELAKIVGPAGRVVGVDRSRVMLDAGREQARAAGVAVEFVEADGAELPLPDATFDACRIDRTLEHISDPAAAVRELARVCRSGGRVALAEPDWDTLAVDAADLGVTRTILHAHTDAYASGTVGRSLRRLLVDAGLGDVVIGHIPVAFVELRLADAVFNIRGAIAKAVEVGAVSRDQADAWWRGLEEAEAAGTFSASMLGSMASARKP